MRYNKLVRDKIPELIRKNSQTPKMHRATPSEYDKKLREKLVEEAKEFVKSGDVDELADVLEVVHAISERKGISKEALESARRKKATERGSFANRTILDEVV